MLYIWYVNQCIEMLHIIYITGINHFKDITCLYMTSFSDYLLINVTVYNIHSYFINDHCKHLLIIFLCCFYTLANNNMYSYMVVQGHKWFTWYVAMYAGHLIDEGSTLRALGIRIMLITLRSQLIHLNDVSMYICMLVYLYICIYVCMYVCMY